MRRVSIVVALVALSACGSGGTATTTVARTTVASVDVGADVGADVGNDGGVVVANGSDRVATAFNTFTPVPDAGWGADQAATALTYRPDPDGLPFPNAAPPRPFDVSDAVALFGADAVCQDTNTPCTAKPAAQAWIDQVAVASAGGVCEGMVVFSLDRFVAGVQPPTMQLTLDADTTSRIVRLFATQFLPQVQEAAAKRRGKNIAEVVQLIESGLQGGGTPYTLGLYGAGGGHALVPYAVRRVSDTQATVYVYDPNWPGLDRYVEFDLARETWRYAMNNANAAADNSPWFGTGDELDLVALDEREAPFDEPFAGAGPGAGRVLLTVTTRSRNWTIDNGTNTINATNARPGRNSVIAVSRGALASGISTYVIEVDGEVSIDAGDGGIDVFVQTDQGTLRGSSTEPGAQYSFADDGSFVLRQDEGSGTLTDYTTTTTTTTTVEPTTTTVAPTTTKPRTTTTQGPPPPNPNQVDVVVTYAQTASGVVSLEVRKRTTTTLDFRVAVVGPGLNAGAGPMSAFNQTFQGLTVNANYVVTVTFTDGTKTVRNFTVP